MIQQFLEKLLELGVDKKQIATMELWSADQISKFVQSQHYELSKRIAEKNKAEAATIELGYCYESIIAFMKRYLEYPEYYYHVIAIWIIGTYFHKQFNTYPFLFFNAMKGTAKTRSLRIVSSLQKGGTGEVLNNPSQAVIFRTAQTTGLIFDEFEQVGTREKATIREILNSAYKKGSKVQRMKKVTKDKSEEHVVEDFNMYTPVAMANIWGMDDVLGDRCITLILERSNNPAVSKKVEDFEDNPTLNQIRNRLNELSVSLCHDVSLQGYVEEWNKYIDFKYNNDITTLYTSTTLNNITTDLKLLDLFNKIDALDIHGRSLELFFPLFIISMMLGPDILSKTLAISKEIINSKKDEELTESKDVMVFDFVSKLSSEYQINYHPLNQIAQRFREFVAEFEEDDQWANVKWLGRSLKRLGLVINKRRLSKGREVMLSVTKAAEKIKMFKPSKENLP